MSAPRTLTSKDKIALAIFAGLTAFPAVICAIGVARGYTSLPSLLTGVFSAFGTQMAWGTLVFIAEGRRHDG